MVSSISFHIACPVINVLAVLLLRVEEAFPAAPYLSLASQMTGLGSQVEARPSGLSYRGPGVG